MEHLFSQSMAGDRVSLLHGLMNLYAVEAGFNNCAEFKQLDSLAERAFLGERTSRMHAAFVTWVNTGSNYKLPSLCFLRSTHCTDTDLATPIYMCSGVRSSGGLLRQVYLPFGAAAGLRSGLKRARVEEVTEVDDAGDTGASSGVVDAAGTSADAGSEVTLLRARVCELERLLAAEREKGAALEARLCGVRAGTGVPEELDADEGLSTVARAPMVAIVEDEANDLFQAASPRVQAKLVSEVAKLVSKRCVPRRTRVWAVWPSCNNVHDGLRVVEALRDADLGMHGPGGKCKILSLRVCLKLSPTPRNALDARLSMVCQSVMHRMVDRSGGDLELHGKTQGLQKTRYSTGFGVCFDDRELFLKAVDDIEQLLHEKLSAYVREAQTGTRRDWP